jgi:type VI secretion system secreted protein Hcp
MATVDFFLKIEGIEGESADAKHKGEIELLTWNWGETQATSQHSNGLGAGKVQMQDFHFVMKVNKASPKLFLACASGEHLKKATLTCRKAGKEQQEYLTIRFKEVLVSSFHSGGTSQGDIVPTEQVGLRFGVIEYEYREQKADGSLGGKVVAGWNVRSHQAV